MLAKKNRLSPWAWMGLVLALGLAGCAPSGTRSLLNGKKLLDAGDYPGAVEEFRTATTLLPASAGAWNYLGVAYQKAQQPDNAATAYQRALGLNRDLVEVHWNLGMLYLEQNKNDLALSEFTAYTLRRPNSPEGWNKLGDVQLRLGQIVPAEQSFGWVLRLDPGNAEAINGQGLARIERNRPRDAIQFFAEALQQHPGDPTAILNLAVTEQSYLHDDRTALQYYQAYLNLTPRPENYDAVSAEANSLVQNTEQAAIPSMPPAGETLSEPPPVTEQRATPPAAPPEKPAVTEMRRFTPSTPVAARPVLNTKPQVALRTSPLAGAKRSVPPPAPVVRSQPVVQTQIVSSAPPRPQATAPVIIAAPANPPPDTAATAPSANATFWDKLKPKHWFAPPPGDKKFDANGVTPLPTSGDLQAEAGADRPVDLGSFPRYSYLQPARPEAGDRRAASGSFTSARVFEQGARYVDAMQQYHSAAEFDPAWFDAQYNYAVLCYRLGDYRQALSAYEMALAIEPASANARYNFALALKAAGYVPDAINELKRLAETHPEEVRAEAALGSIYAQKVRDTAQAREHYAKVLAIDPGNAEAPGIRRWLAAHGG